MVEIEIVLMDFIFILIILPLLRIKIWEMEMEMEMGRILGMFLRRFFGVLSLGFLLRSSFLFNGNLEMWNLLLYCNFISLHLVHNPTTTSYYFDKHHPPPNYSSNSPQPHFHSRHPKRPPAPP